jgi:integrase
MPIYYDKSRKRWRYEFSRIVNGQRQRITKLLPKEWSREDAQAYSSEQDGRLFAVATGAAKRRPLISEALLLYLTEHAPGLKNQAILTRELAQCEAAYRGRYIDELAGVARAYAKQQAAHLKPATIRNRMAYLRAACRWAWKTHGLGQHDPAERLVLPKVKNERHRYITRLDMLKIARAMTNRDARAVALVAFYSGMRLGEVLRAEPTERGWLLSDTKNGERRMIPVHGKVAHIARRWPRTIHVRTVQGCFSKAAQGLGYTDLRFHDLRHSSASEMINSGVNLYTVGAVLGHKSAQSTKRYAHLSSDSLLDAVATIGKKKAG